MSDPLTLPCPECDGKGVSRASVDFGGTVGVQALACPTCSGRGVILNPEVWIPATRRLAVALEVWAQNVLEAVSVGGPKPTTAEYEGVAQVLWDAALGWEEG